VRFVLHASSSRGDIIPFIALGQRLKELGHSVVMALSPMLEALAFKHELDFSPVGSAISQSEIRATSLEAIATLDPASQWITVMKRSEAYLPGLYTDLATICRSADALIASLSFGIPKMVEEATGIPHLSMRISDFGENDHEFLEKTSVPMNNLRKSLGFSPIAEPFGSGGHSPNLVLYASSPFLTGRKDAVGFLFPKRTSFRLPPSLQEFIDEGEKPILLTFGSAIFEHPERIGAAVVEAAAENGKRIIVQKGSWLPDKAALERFGPFVKVIGPIPHESFIDKIELVIHHGGGVITECLRAGVPSISIPCLCDNFVWASLLVKHGVSPATIPLRELHKDSLAQAITHFKTSLPAYQSNATALAGVIKCEPGVSAAAAKILELLR